MDDVLVVSHAPEEVMKQIGAEFEIQNNEYGPPTSYLGTGISKVTLNGRAECWSMDSKKYVKAALEVIRGFLARDGRELRTSKGKHKGPLAINYCPKLDATAHCDEEHASYYQQIIGIFRWAIKLGRIDILTEVALLSQFQANPCKGHLEALYCVANYLHRYPTRRLIFNHTAPENIDDSVSKSGNWTEFYGKVTKEDPPNMPVPLGNPVVMSCFVDADHAGNLVTSHLIQEYVSSSTTLRLLCSERDKTLLNQVLMDQDLLQCVLQKIWYQPYELS
jgi:hypothetical protein